MGKWLELASLMITSAELVFSKVSETGRMLFFSRDHWYMFLLGLSCIPLAFWPSSISIDEKHECHMVCVCCAIFWAGSFSNSATLFGYGIVDVWYSLRLFFLIMLHFLLPFLVLHFSLSCLQSNLRRKLLRVIGLFGCAFNVTSYWECVNKFCYFLYQI